MKDLFVELCLTVPVRLSSLLPYLPMLMDPLVSALNGSQTLVNQGLRTLELCVDNLQPDFLYEHIQVNYKFNTWSPRIVRTLGKHKPHCSGTLMFGLICPHFLIKVANFLTIYTLIGNFDNIKQYWRCTKLGPHYPGNSCAQSFCMIQIWIERYKN